MTKAEIEDLFNRADKQYEAGKLRSAFRLFLAAAKAGDSSCQVNLGNFYCHGTGVRANRAKALYWYRRAYRQGRGCSASNIGMLFQHEQKFRQALTWFEWAVRLGDGDANLLIANLGSSPALGASDHGDIGNDQR
jgi:TPR repeat protein